MLRSLLRVIPMGILLFALACGGSGDGEEGTSTVRARTLTFPHALNKEHPVSKAIEKFADEVETRSGGALVVKIFEGGTMGSEQELVDNVAAGTNDFTKVSSTILEAKTDLAKVYSLPYLFRSSEHMWKVLDGEIGKELLDMATEKGLKGICYYDAGFRSFYMKKGPIETPDDLIGSKIRVQKSPMMELLIRTLGAIPQQIQWSELYTSLDTGVVDGAENNIPSYYTANHYRVATFYSYDEHVGVPDMALMSTETWDSLTADQQKIIMEAAAVSSKYERQIWDEEIQKNVEKMKAEGVTFTYPDKAPFIEKTKPIYDQFEGTPVGDYAKRIRAVQ